MTRERNRRRKKTARYRGRWVEREGEKAREGEEARERGREG